MLKSFNEDFDLQVRSMMDQAQEPAPAGAWEAISSRLDALAAAGLQPAASEAPAAAAASSAPASAAAASARPVRRVWYWAGAALAMAAAIALGIFFSGTSDNNSNLINITSGEGLVAQEVAPAAEPAREAAPVTEAPVASVAQPEATAKVAPRGQNSPLVTTNPEKSASRGQIEADMTTAPVDQTVRSEKQPVSGTNSENSVVRSEKQPVSGTDNETVQSPVRPHLLRPRLKWTRSPRWPSRIHAKRRAALLFH